MTKGDFFIIMILVLSVVSVIVIPYLIIKLEDYLKGRKEKTNQWTQN